MHETAEKTVQNKKTPAPPTVMTRVFDAPRALVFEMWSGEHLKNWFAPKPMTIPHCEVELRAGGILKFTMRMPDGSAEYPFLGKFEEVIKNEKIVFSGLVHDDNTCHTVVTFEDAPGGKTKLSVRQTYAYASPATGGAVQGWTSTLDNLAEQLSGKR